MRISKMCGWTKNLFLIAAAGCLLAMTGCAGLQGLLGFGGGGPTQPPMTATISFCDMVTSNCQSNAGTFTASGTQGVNIAVKWQNTPLGNHTQQIQLLMPDGNFYQEFQAGFLIDSASNGQASITRAIPIAGTFITQRKLLGTWKVQVLLDGAVVNTANLHLN